MQAYAYGMAAKALDAGSRRNGASTVSGLSSRLSGSKASSARRLGAQSTRLASNKRVPRRLATLSLTENQESLMKMPVSIWVSSTSSTSIKSGMASRNQLYTVKRSYSDQANKASSEGKAEKDKTEAKAPFSDFGTTPASASQGSINNFRDGMKKEAGRLSMEPSEVPKATETMKKSTSAPAAPIAASTPKSKRGLVLILVLLGLIGGVVTVGYVGNWIDEYQDEERRRRGLDYSSSPSSAQEDSSAPNTQWKVIVKRLAELDEAALNWVLSSSLIQNIKSSLGFGSKTETSHATSSSGIRPQTGGSVTPVVQSVSTSGETNHHQHQHQQTDQQQHADGAADHHKEEKKEEKEERDSPAHFNESFTASSSTLSSSSSSNATPEEASVGIIPQHEETTSLGEGAVNSSISASESTSESSRPSDFNESYATTTSATSTSSSSSTDSSALDSSSATSEEATSPLSSPSDVIQLLEIENDEMRALVIKLLSEIENLQSQVQTAEARVLQVQADAVTKTALIEEDKEAKLRMEREAEAQRVMEILKAYETKLQEQIAALKTSYDSKVGDALEDLKSRYEGAIDQWKRDVDENVSLWGSKLVNTDVASIIHEFTERSEETFSKFSALSGALGDTEKKLSEWREASETSASFVRVSRAFILLQHKLHNTPGSPFFVQLQEYLQAANEIPALAQVVKSLAMDPLLLQTSKLGAPTLTELKQEFTEAARAARTAALAPEQANAFQHSWASLKELVISSTNLGTPSTTNHIGEVAGAAVESSPSSSSSSSSVKESSPSSSEASSSSSSSDQFAIVSSYNWALLSAAEDLLKQDMLSSAIDNLSKLQGPSALFMKPWLQRAQQTLLVQSTFSFLAMETANLSFGTPSDKEGKHIKHPQQSSL